MKKNTSLFVGLLLVLPSFGQISGGGAGNIGTISLHWPSKIRLASSMYPGVFRESINSTEVELTYPLAITTFYADQVFVTFYDLPSISTVTIEQKWYDENNTLIEELPANEATPGYSNFQFHPGIFSLKTPVKYVIYARVKSPAVYPSRGYLHKLYTFTYNFR